MSVGVRRRRLERPTRPRAGRARRGRTIGAVDEDVLQSGMSRPFSMMVCYNDIGFVVHNFSITLFLSPSHLAVADKCAPAELLLHLGGDVTDGTRTRVNEIMPACVPILSGLMSNELVVPRAPRSYNAMWGGGRSLGVFRITLISRSPTRDSAASAEWAWRTCEDIDFLRLCPLCDSYNVRRRCFRSSTITSPFRELYDPFESTGVGVTRKCRASQLESGQRFLLLRIRVRKAADPIGCSTGTTPCSAWKVS